jgi:phosphomannomutase
LPRSKGHQDASFAVFRQFETLTIKREKFITPDGYKHLLPNREWVAFRASGTEPLIRCYVEAKSAAYLKQLRAACRKLLEA